MTAAITHRVCPPHPPIPPPFSSPSSCNTCNSLQDCASSFTKGNHTYDENDTGFKALQRCATLCNVALFQEDSKTDKEGVPVPFKKVKVQGDGSAIEVRRISRLTFCLRLLCARGVVLLPPFVVVSLYPCLFYLYHDILMMTSNIFRFVCFGRVTFGWRPSRLVGIIL